jgi:hypothetical protein
LSGDFHAFPLQLLWISASAARIQNGKVFAGFPLEHVILGPNVVPGSWATFPNPRSPIESHWSSHLDKIFAYAVHTERVKRHLIGRSRTQALGHKYVLLPQCSGWNLDWNLIPFSQRRFDILLFEKYADLNRAADGEFLSSLIVRDNLSMVRVRYGRFRRADLELHARQSRFLIYFSFYDAGPIALLEMQNFGAYSFCLQPELVDNATGSFIPTLETNVTQAWLDIRARIAEVSRASPNSTEYARLNRERSSCHRSLDVFCRQVVALSTSSRSNSSTRL